MIFATRKTSRSQKAVFRFFSKLHNNWRDRSAPDLMVWVIDCDDKILETASVSEKSYDLVK